MQWTAYHPISEVLKKRSFNYVMATPRLALSRHLKALSCLKFKNDLVNAVDSISSDFGSVKKKELQLCDGYSKACFVETFESPNMPIDIDPIIKDSILSGTGRNVFLVENIAKESFYAGKISVDPDVLCINAVNSKITIKLEEI